MPLKIRTELPKRYQAISTNIQSRRENKGIHTNRITSKVSQELQPMEFLGRYSITTLKEEETAVDHRCDGKLSSPNQEISTRQKA
jgi:hypothetical protein